LAGGPGLDTLSGGSGADSFLLGPPSGLSTDTIMDFESGINIIQVMASDYGLVAGDPVIFETGDAPTTGEAEFFYDPADLTPDFHPAQARVPG
jgi:Ca2+-binding RTX toxin-like protein